MGEGPADAWSPGQYQRFRREREQPFRDLLSLVRKRAGMKVVDLGCGPGELTRLLHSMLAARETVGIDASDAMLAQAHGLEGEGLRFEKGDLAAFAPAEPVDLVFSNAAIHWVPEHGPLLARLRAALRASGQIAIQVPANDDHPAHAAAAETAHEPRFRRALGGFVLRFPLLDPAQYASWLHRLGFTEQLVRLHVYVHELAGRDEVIEFTKGALLTAYRKRLAPELYSQFLERYREILIPQLQDEEPFVFTYKRIFMWGQLPPIP